MKRWLIALTVAVTATPALHAQDAARPAPGNRYVYLIRHGIYDPDSTVKDDRLGNALNAMGHEQAKLAGRRLAKLPVKMASLVSSDYLRAKETAEDIGRELSMTPRLDSLIHECMPTSGRADYRRYATPEENALCDSNLARAWERYAKPSPDGETHDVLVCHGNVIRWFVARTLGMDLQRWHTMDIGNGSLTVIAVRPDGSTRLVIYSDVGHLPVEQQTWTGRGAGWGKPPARR